jgi:secondary thiamine-phosphate synthase enzyme
MQEFKIQTTAREEFIEITDQVQEILDKMEWGRGCLLVYCPHTTAALTINETVDPNAIEDMKNLLSKIVPRSADYTHSDGNSDAHIKSTLLGQSLTLLVEHGAMQLGTWQGLYLYEGDGPRERSIWLQFIAS